MDMEFNLKEFGELGDRFFGGVSRKSQTPCSDGFYWWRRAPNHEWQLTEVVASPFLARFYNGSRISICPWGEWQKAEVSNPNDNMSGGR